MKKCNTEIMKIIKALDEEKSALIVMEQQNSKVIYSTGEKKLNGDYDFDAVTKRIDEIDDEILKLKGKLSLSNATTAVEEFSMTISEALVYLAELQNKKDRYVYLSSSPKKRRLSVNREGVVEYEETLYDPKLCLDKAKEISEMISRLQMAIDRTNLNNMIEL
ncbi:MAG: hypothetical protein PUK83_01145 [Clostridia bacterium]|nr:hypothetical protein [Clostridia bacterium]MDY5264271.1 hypothetical protein [Eubacteriales bacterium]MDY5440396.1 hypothetical protein [Eubacteriales bacterium]